jgi:glutaconate CoA-transferase subunit B
MGVFSFDRDSREMILASHHPGVTVTDIQRETGWPLLVAPDVQETPAPTREELAAVRKYDPKAIWTS